MTTPLHPDVESLAVLLGTWSGEGHGEYPTIEPFNYTETVSFSHVAKPFLAYAQRTAHAFEDRPLHSEVGYLRVASPGRIELVVAHPTGIAEVAEGGFDGSSLRLRSTVVARSSTAKEVTAVERDFVVEGDVLSTSSGWPLSANRSRTTSPRNSAESGNRSGRGAAGEDSTP